MTVVQRVFNFNDQDLIIHQDIRHDLWFRGTQVCQILGFANSSEALRTHVPDMIQELAIGEGRPAYYVSEKGLYILCFRAKTSQALEFQLWTAEVLKTIRKTGTYQATSEDRQHFIPFGLTLQLKIDECDRALESAIVGSGQVKKLLADRKMLENLIKTQARPKSSNLKHKRSDVVLDRDALLAYCSDKPSVTMSDILSYFNFPTNSHSLRTQIGSVLVKSGWRSVRESIYSNGIQARPYRYVHPDSVFNGSIYTFEQ